MSNEFHNFFPRHETYEGVQKKPIPNILAIQLPGELVKKFNVAV